MTLPTVAQHLAAHGRNGDEMLVHMTPHEVAGLEALARAKYGHGLPTNPDTGLPEASILGGLLPAVLGVAGSFFGLPPMLTAGLVGGGTALATGSFGKGLMAGIGAFGGASMGAGFGAMGAGAGAGSAASSAGSIASEMAPDMAAGMGSTTPEFVGGLGAAPEAMSGMDLAADAPSGFGGYAGDMTAAGYDPGYAGGPSPMGAGAGMPSAAPSSAQPPGVVQRVAGKALDPISPWQEKWANFSNAVGNNKKVLQYGMMAAAPMLSEGIGQPKVPPTPESNALLRPYRYDPMTQKYTALPTIPAKDANSMKFYAGGGKVKGFALGGINDLLEQVADHVPNASPQISLPFSGTGGGGVGAGIGSSPGTQAAFPAADFTKTFSNPSGKAGMGTSVMAINPATGMPAPVGAWPGPYQAPSMLPTAPAGDHKYNYDPATQTFTPTTPASAPGETAPTALGGSGPFDLHDPNQMIAWVNSMGSGSSSVSGDTGPGGSYAAGGRLLRGPGDGVSDSIPAVVGGGTPARLANEEYVVPARVVAEIGNGSSSAGAKQLDAMVRRVQQRAATATRSRAAVAKDTNARGVLPA